MARVWAQSKRKDGELLVMLALGDFSNDEGECWPALDTLAEKARLSKPQLCKVLKKLEDANEIRRSRSSGGRNRRTIYFINLPTENSKEKTVKKEHCINNSVSEDSKTVSPARHALNHHKTVNRESLKGKPSHSNADSRVKEFFVWWDGQYQERFKQSYVFNGGKEGALVKRLLSHHDLKRLQSLAGHFFDSGDRWVKENGGFTIGVFASQINKIVSTSKTRPEPNEMPL